jgi:hypothetical protein
MFSNQVKYYFLVCVRFVFVLHFHKKPDAPTVPLVRKHIWITASSVPTVLPLLFLRDCIELVQPLKSEYLGHSLIGRMQRFFPPQSWIGSADKTF